MGSAGKKLRTRMDIGKDIQNCLDDLNNIRNMPIFMESVQQQSTT